LRWLGGVEPALRAGAGNRLVGPRDLREAGRLLAVRLSATLPIRRPARGAVRLPGGAAERLADGLADALALRARLAKRPVQGLLTRAAMPGGIGRPRWLKACSRAASTRSVRSGGSAAEYGWPSGPMETTVEETSTAGPYWNDDGAPVAFPASSHKIANLDGSAQSTRTGSCRPLMTRPRPSTLCSTLVGAMPGGPGVLGSLGIHLGGDASVGGRG